MSTAWGLEVRRQTWLFTERRKQQRLFDCPSWIANDHATCVWEWTDWCEVVVYNIRQTMLLCIALCCSLKLAPQCSPVTLVPLECSSGRRSSLVLPDHTCFSWNDHSLGMFVQCPTQHYSSIYTRASNWRIKTTFHVHRLSHYGTQEPGNEANSSLCQCILPRTRVCMDSLHLQFYHLHTCQPF